MNRKLLYIWLFTDKLFKYNTFKSSHRCLWVSTASVEFIRRRNKYFSDSCLLFQPSSSFPLVYSQRQAELWFGQRPSGASTSSCRQKAYTIFISLSNTLPVWLQKKKSPQRKSKGDKVQDLRFIQLPLKIPETQRTTLIITK